MFKFLRGRILATPRTALLKGNKSYDFEVVGEANYQDSLSSICGGKCEEGHSSECVAALVMDDRNAFDKNAVAVAVDGKLVGYLPRHAAVEYRSQLAKLGLSDAAVGCRAVIRGGWDRGNGDEGSFGIWLDVLRPLAIQSTT